MTDITVKSFIGVIAMLTFHPIGLVEEFITAKSFEMLYALVTFSTIYT